MVVFVLNGRRYALRLSAVDSVLWAVEITALPGGPDIVEGVVNVHGKIVPVFDIRRRFGLGHRDAALNDHLILARTSRRLVGLPVDEVLGVMRPGADEVVSSEAILPGIPHIAGVIKLEDGLILIHDLERFLSPDEERHLDQAMEAPPS